MSVKERIFEPATLGVIFLIIAIPLVVLLLVVPLAEPRPEPINPEAGNPSGIPLHLPMNLNGSLIWDRNTILPPYCNNQLSGPGVPRL